MQVTAFHRRHARALYNMLRQDPTLHVAQDTLKWFQHIMGFASDIGVREDNPVNKFTVEEPTSRKAVWTKEEVETTIGAALVGGRASSGNAPPRPSIALATLIAYDVGQQPCDVLVLQ